MSGFWPLLSGVDFEGINGGMLVRQAQIRVFPKIGESMSLKLSLEDPKTDVANGRGTSNLWYIQS